MSKTQPVNEIVEDFLPDEPSSEPPAGTPLTPDELIANYLVDPSQTGITHLREIDETALRMWTVKGPKDTPSTISAVLLQETGQVVMLHQFAGGKYRIFEPKAA